MKYTQHLLDSFYNPSGCGTISGAHVVCKVEDKETGDAVKYFFVLNGDIIKEVKFQACGSVVLFASLSAITSLITGLSLMDASNITEKQVIKEIKQVNRCDYSTISFAIAALNKAILTATKKLEKGLTQIQKKVKVRNLTTSKDLKVYTEEEVVEDVEESPIEIKQLDDEEDLALPAPIVITQEDADEDEVEKFEPQIVVSKKDVIESVPTKIEVRVVEEDDNVVNDVIEEPQKEEIVIETEIKETENLLEKEDKEDKPAEVFVLNENKSKKHLLDEPVSSNDDVIDEIDSITAKLTDAITKLNFKFDVDED